MYNGKAPTTHFYVVGAEGELADVVVSLKACHRQIHRRERTARRCIDQKGCLYTPQILAVQTGQKVVVKNSDHLRPQCSFQADGGGNKESNDVQMPGGADLTYTFAKPEMFLKFQCDVHPWMFAWVSVFDQPVFRRERQGRQVHHQKCAGRQIHRRSRAPQARQTDRGRRGQGRRRDREFHVRGEIIFRRDRDRCPESLRSFLFRNEFKRYNPALFWFAVLTAFTTFLLIGLGGLVTSHEAGMSVPDWPTTYGYNMFVFPLDNGSAAFFTNTRTGCWRRPSV